MATFSTSIAKNAKNFAYGVDGVTGRGKKIAVTIGGTPETGDRFNIKLGNRNFGFVGKPVGDVVALVTLKQKVYAAAGTILFYSGIATPTRWETATDIGAGFINMSDEYGGSEELTGLAAYQNNLAVFARWTTQIWYVDPDDTGNRQLQVLDNIGCIAPKSVVSVGDIDVFFLSDTGIRSLRTRDNLNAAFISDVGTPVDPAIISALRGLTEAEKADAVAVIEPEDGRFWMQLGGIIYVFSYFSSAKISAWSSYTPASPATDLAILEGRVYARGQDNSLYLYGGADNNTYDTTQVTAVTPFLDARAPATWKMLEGIDMGIQGEWLVDICTDPRYPDAWERIAQYNDPTYTLQRIALAGNTTHFKLRLQSVGAGYARLSNVAVHYRSNESG